VAGLAASFSGVSGVKNAAASGNQKLMRLTGWRSDGSLLSGWLSIIVAEEIVT